MKKLEKKMDAHPARYFQKSRLLCMLCGLGLFAGCAGVQPSFPVSDFEAKVKNINALMAKPQFSPDGSQKIESNGHCKVTLTSNWNESVSREKGYESVVTVTELDLSTDASTVSFVPAYTDILHDRKEIWSDSIRLKLKRELMVDFNAVPIGEEKVAPTKYVVNAVTIGVLDAEKNSEIAELVDALSELIENCEQS